MLKRPMLAGKFDPEVNKPPFAVQPKIDGFRCIVSDGVGYSRTLRPLPNRHIQEFISDHKEWLEGFDGELTVGDPKNPKVFSNTGIMAADGKPDFVFTIFDLWNQPNTTYKERLDLLMGIFPDVGVGHIRLVDTIPVESFEAFETAEAQFVADGYEGAIVRKWNGLYKPNRSTTKEGLLLKVKRFEDDEATIIGFEELLSNQNEATIGRLGLTERSSHKAGKVPMNTLGKLVCKNDRWPEFRVGSGFDQALRQEIWDNKDVWVGKTIKFKHFPIGGYDKPRHAIYLGVRHAIDVGEPK
jgi:DNA ligase-1